MSGREAGWAASGVHGQEMRVWGLEGNQNRETHLSSMELACDGMHLASIPNRRDEGGCAEEALLRMKRDYKG